MENNKSKSLKNDLNEYSILKHNLDLNTKLVRDLKYPELMVVYPIKNGDILCKSCKKLQSKSDSECIQELKLNLTSKRGSRSEFHTIQYISSIYIDGQYSMSKSAVVTSSVPRFLLGILELIKKREITERGKKVIFEDFKKMLSQSYSVIQPKSSLMSSASSSLRVCNSGLDKLSEVVRGLAVSEYNPCFSVQDIRVFKKYLQHLLNSIQETQYVTPIEVKK